MYYSQYGSTSSRRRAAPGQAAKFIHSLSFTAAILRSVLVPCARCGGSLAAAASARLAPRLHGLPGPKTGPGGVVRRPEPDSPHSGLDEEPEGPPQDPAL